MSHSSQFSNSPDQPRQALRVLHVIKGLGPGGAERLILNQIATSMSNIVYSVAFAVPYKDHLVDELSDFGATVTLLDHSQLPLSLRRLVTSFEPHVVHAHSPVMAVNARLLRAARVGGFSLVTTEHNRWPRHHPMTRIANRATAHLDDARIAVSLDVSASMTPSIASTTDVIDHGIPLDDIANARASRARIREEILGEDNGHLFVIGIVANFRPEKDYETFLKAARHALLTVPELHLVVVGQGPGEREFREKVADQERLHVLGYRADVHDVMSAFDGFTLSSRHEGKPVALMEALALGLPTVATRAGGIPEVIEDGKNGLLVDIGDHQALSEGWIQIATDRELHRSLREQATASGRRFDARVATLSIEEIYRLLR